LIVLCISGFIISGCATQQAKPAPVPTPAPTPAPAPVPQKTVEMKLAHYFPPTAGGAIATTNLVNRIQERSKGMLKITIYPTESLVKQADLYDACASGMADMVASQFIVDPSRQSLSLFCELPGLNWQSVESSIKVVWTS